MVRGILVDNGVWVGDGEVDTGLIVDLTVWMFAATLTITDGW